MTPRRSTHGAAGAKLVSDALAAHRVVVFAIPGCEYCAIAARTLAAQLGALHSTPGCTPPPAAVVTLQSTPVGAAARHDLQLRTGSATLPAVFLDSSYIGGATETVQLSRSGVLLATLRRLAGCGGATPDL